MHKMIVVKKNQKYAAMINLSTNNPEHQDRSNSRIISTEHLTNPSQRSLQQLIQKPNNI